MTPQLRVAQQQQEQQPSRHQLTFKFVSSMRKSMAAAGDGMLRLLLPGVPAAAVELPVAAGGVAVAMALLVLLDTVWRLAARRAAATATGWR
jgi:hypothetical protein